MDSEEEKEETPEVCAYKRPVSKPWVSLGSEKEVEEESVKERVKKVQINRSTHDKYHKNKFMLSSLKSRSQKIEIWFDWILKKKKKKRVRKNYQT